MKIITLNDILKSEFSKEENVFMTGISKTRLGEFIENINEDNFSFGILRTVLVLNVRFDNYLEKMNGSIMGDIVTDINQDLIIETPFSFPELTFIENIKERMGNYHANKTKQIIYRVFNDIVINSKEYFDYQDRDYELSLGGDSVTISAFRSDDMGQLMPVFTKKEVIQSEVPLFVSHNYNPFKMVSCCYKDLYPGVRG